ncbi:Uracil DNA glycosylase superfamily protein [Butyrivibrio sp. ob235]|uniref:hypothetical protein n=1 Tax=Butyrivibrio sp. ob235 TaxID=1761780 RepID=UPI0008B90C1C|nr:hypothetical protein [Butyrivibrio sp. ob235]SEM42856.1 Uracil DNA glycosylase superfamily protein [Butyrivibrio sp. ob235]
MNSYITLIRDVSDYYNSALPELKNIKNNDNLFDLVWCRGLTEEINLWTYWQGRGIENPEVMIIGQDFGICTDEDNGSFYEKCAKSSMGEREFISNEYIKRVKADEKNKTDNMLIKLTKEGLGKEYSADIPSNPKLFMTNACLGYRSGNKISGGNLSAYIKHDSKYIAKLIDIKRPKVVICLGTDTYFNLVSSFINDRTKIRNIAEDFWKSLDDGTNYQDIQFEGFEVRFFGVSHAGQNGAINRIRDKSIPKGDRISTASKLMVGDWKRIGDYLRDISCSD